MPRRTPRDPVKEQRWRQILRAWNASGKTRSEFCRSRQLFVNTFDFWRRQLVKRDGQSAARTRPAAPPAKPVLLPITITSPASLEIHLTNGTRITVPGGVDPKGSVSRTPLRFGGPIRRAWMRAGRKREFQQVRGEVRPDEIKLTWPGLRGTGVDESPRHREARSPVALKSESPTRADA